MLPVEGLLTVIHFLIMYPAVMMRRRCRESTPFDEQHT